MKQDIDHTRRRLLRNVALGVALIPLARAPLEVAAAADMPLVSADDPTAKALKYTSDASTAKDAKPGSKCGNCRLYQGAANSAEGGCVLFPGKSVKAGGWCMSWTAKT
jgi:High potential iron-sulfur protein